MTTSRSKRLGGGVLGSFESGPSLLLMAILIVYPLFSLLLQIVFPDVFNYHMSWAFSLAPIRQVFDNPLNVESITNSLWIGAVAAIVSVVVGTVTAFGAMRASGVVKKVIDAGVWIIFFAPSYVIASGWVVLLGPGGIAQQGLGLPADAFNWFFTPIGLFLVMGLRYFPFAHFAMTQAIQNIGPEYVNAARMLGARRFTVLRRVWLQLLMPAMLAGASIAFADGFGDFGLAAVITPQMQIPMISYQIYSALYETPVAFSSAAVLSLLVVIVTAGALILQFWWLNKRRYNTLTSSSWLDIAPERRRIGGFTWSALVIVLLGLVLPFGATVVESFWKTQTAGLSWSNWTFSAYTAAFGVGGAGLAALGRSLSYALVAAVAVAVIGLFVAQQMTFAKTATSKVLNILTMSTIAIPGVVLAAGFVFAWNARWLIPLNLVLYGTPICLAMAYVAGHLPYAIRLQLSSLAQVSPNLLTAGQILGAKRHVIVRKIVIPLVRETVISTFLITLTGVIFELPAASLLYPPGQPPFSVLIQSQFNSFEWAQGSALAIVGMVIVIGFYAGGTALLRRGLRAGGLRSAGPAWGATAPPPGATALS
jgi:iron(III) transport system permease protein